jgi:transposase-like protein
MSSGNEEKEEKKYLTPQQRGAMITNSGKSPIASLAEEDRKALVQAVLERAVEDERLADIAKDYGVSRTGLNKALLKYAEEDWKETQVARALTLVEDCEDDLESAADMVAISRARERLKSAHWKLERLHRRLFGQEAPNQSGSGTISINIGISRSAEPTDITPDNVVIEGK